MEENKKESKIDPVCGMDLAEYSDTESLSYKGKNYYFCGDVCLGRFKQETDRFLGEPLVKLRNVWKVFKMGESETQVLRGVDLHIWEGDFVALIGASGSGKSTTLNMIGLLDRPTSGKIFLKGKDVSLLSDEERAALRSGTFGFVFQQYNLIPWLTAYENVTLPRVFANRIVDEAQIESRFDEMELKPRMTHRSFELSGGEQQRIALLRALANDPSVIIGDEPTGNLDSATGNKILDILIKLHDVGKKTFIIVTHDADIAQKAHQLITIKDGRIVRNHHLFKKMYTE